MDDSNHAINDQTDYWAKDVSWKDVKKGRLHVTNQSLQVFKKRFLRKPALVWDIPISSITAVHLSGDAGEIAVESNLGSAALTDRLVLTRASDARQAFEKINALFEACRAQREQERKAKEEAERKAREEAERKRRQALQTYHDLVFAAAAQFWRLTQGLYQIIFDIRRAEDWEAAGKSFQDARGEAAGIATKAALGEVTSFAALEKALGARDGEQVVTECAETLGRLVELVDTARPLIPDWEGGDITDSATPNWRHLGYVVLFSASYNEAVLTYDIGNRDVALTEAKSLDRAGKLVKELFGLDLGTHISELRKAIETGNREMLWKIDSGLDQFVNDFFNRQQTTAAAQLGLAKE